MSRLRGIAELNRAARDQEISDHRPYGDRFIFAEPDASARCYASSEGCLTHITRHITFVPPMEFGPLSINPRSWCGSFPGSRGFRFVDPAAELFGCHACISRCEELGLPTYGLVPNNGCEATGGQRYRPSNHQRKAQLT